MSKIMMKANKNTVLMKGYTMFGYDDLIVTEQQVYNVTLNRLKGFYDDGPKFVDLCFYLHQSFGEMDIVTTPTGELQSIAYMHFVQLPYTVKLIYEQIMKGYYLESQILVRHLFETLLHLKYFYNNPENIKTHIANNISTKKMVGSITKKPLYGYYRHLCTYTHGFIMKDIHRTDRKANKTYLGNFYNEVNCTVPINYFSDLMLGFINIFDVIFPQNTLEENIDARELKNYLTDWCTSARNSHMKINKDSIKMHDAMSDLIF